MITARAMKAPEKNTAVITSDMDPSNEIGGNTTHTGMVNPAWVDDIWLKLAPRRCAELGCYKVIYRALASCPTIHRQVCRDVTGQMHSQKGTTLTAESGQLGGGGSKGGLRLNRTFRD